jgi:ribosome modulation factor
MMGSLTEAGQRWQLEREFSPAMQARQRQDLLNGWRQAVSRAI